MQTWGAGGRPGRVKNQKMLQTSYVHGPLGVNAPSLHALKAPKLISAHVPFDLRLQVLLRHRNGLYLIQGLRNLVTHLAFK